jgi:hypothetical protein
MASLFVHEFSYELNAHVTRITCHGFSAAGRDEFRMLHLRGRAFS